MIDLSVVDIVVIILYFTLVFGIAGWITFKEKVNESSSDYFLGGRNLGWFVIGASLFASNIGSEHLVGLAGSGASSGVAVGQFEIMAGFMLLLLGWVFVPFYIRSGVFTMPEFLELRYSKGARTYLSLVSIIAYVLTKISVTIAAGAIVFQAVGVEFWTGALVIVIVTGIYTVFGGLKAVIYTDMIQMFVLVGGAIAVTLIGLNALGGWDALYASADESFFTLWQPISHPDFPWTGIIFGSPIIGVWYWCTDQFIVQRVLSAKDVSNARKGTIFAGFLKILPLFIFVIPGVIAYGLAQKGVITLEKPDQALVILIKELMPSGIRGLVIAGLLAALMSSLSSVFNSCSTLFTLDFYKKYNPEASERHLVIVGQFATIVLVALGLAWIPLMQLISDGLFTYLQSIQAYISPPIAAVFFLGIFFKRLNAQGAMACLWTGFVLAIFRLTIEINKDNLTGVLHDLAVMNFLHFAILLFLVCTIVLFSVSIFTKAPDYVKIEGITYQKESRAMVVKSRDVWWSIGMVAIIAVVWVYFS